MKNRLRTRLTALLALSLLLLTGAGDAFGAHPCPHHQAVARAAVDADAAHAHGSAHAHASHDATTPAAPTDHGEGACTCAGDCAVAAGAALPIPPHGIVPAPASVAASGARVADEVLPARLLPYVLPYAQAPPRLG